MNSAIRRHHYERRKAAAKYLFQYIYKGPSAECAQDEGMMGLWANTRVPCSCPLCGNPRKHFNEITNQEYLAKISEEEQWQELQHI
jgi:rubredoxin